MRLKVTAVPFFVEKVFRTSAQKYPHAHLVFFQPRPNRRPLANQARLTRPQPAPQAGPIFFLLREHQAHVAFHAFEDFARAAAQNLFHRDGEGGVSGTVGGFFVRQFFTFFHNLEVGWAIQLLQ